MKILVTGGAGFIGSAEIRHAITLGHQVVNLDALTYAACLANVASVAEHPGYAFEQADIRDRAAVNRIFTTYRPDAVIHLTAERHVDHSIDGSSNFVRTLQERQSLQVGSPDAIAWAQEWIEDEAVTASAKFFGKTGYGAYLKVLKNA